MAIFILEVIDMNENMVNNDIKLLENRIEMLENKIESVYKVDLINTNRFILKLLSRITRLEINLIFTLIILLIITLRIRHII